MSGGGRAPHGEPPDKLARLNLCISDSKTRKILQHGDDHFDAIMGRFMSAVESRASERLVRLKHELQAIYDLNVFWPMAAQGLTDIVDAQLALVSRRILYDDQESAVEMPPLGEPGSCLMAEVFYYNDGHGKADGGRKWKHHAYSCPCAYMRHEKTFIIPEKLGEVFDQNPNQADLPFICDSYIGVPLFAEGKCVAHFAVFWTEEGAAKRQLSWGFIEMMLHSLEDMFIERLVKANGRSPVQLPQRVIPSNAVTPAQSLKPYARSLSHELRTPMQGIVGMLDIMFATVQEAQEGQRDPRLLEIFDRLRENIETVQDSSRRAVEAADNVVHAYDLNMGVPDTAYPQSDDEDDDENMNETKDRSNLPIAGHVPIGFRGTKRRRESQNTWYGESTTKPLPTGMIDYASNGYQLDPAFEEPKRKRANTLGQPGEESHTHPTIKTPKQRPMGSPNFNDFGLVPGLRNTRLRELLQFIVNDGLKIGGRPESAIASETEGGEFIDVTTRSSNGDELHKTVEWSVDPGVPETMLVDERDLSKLISCVFLNAVKFTDEGSVKISTRLSHRSRYVLINVSDTGCGIPDEFVPNLFKAFSREDQSLTRQSEGLGLGLLVAKGLARKLGGDLKCIRSETTGPNHGSEFEMRVPLTPGDDTNGAATSSYSPSPSHPMRASEDAEESLIASAERTPKTVTGKSTRERRTSASHAPLRRPPIVTSHPVMEAGAGKPTNSLTTPLTDKRLGSVLPLNFLVVEDNKVIRRVLVSMLRKLGYEKVNEASDGADAVRQVTANLADPERAIDVVLMDLWMPFMDGYEATERILTLGVERLAIDETVRPPTNPAPPKPKIPVVLAVTADVTHGAVDRAKSIGMKGFMSKPYRLVDLERLIVEHCQRDDLEAQQHARPPPRTLFDSERKTAATALTFVAGKGQQQPVA